MAAAPRDDRAVSPVIGVVLVVAITVVLAAGTATLLLGTGVGLHQPSSAPLAIEQVTFTENEDCPGPEEVAIDETFRFFAAYDGQPQQLQSFTTE